MPLALQSVNGVHVAALSGPLDNSAGTDLVATIKSSVEKGASIILDCTQVSGMDVAGFKHLLALHRWSQVGNGRLVLAGMSPEAWSLIVENHCENTFESRPSVPAAFQALGVSGDPATTPPPPPAASGYDAYPEPPPYPTGGSASGMDDPYAQTFPAAGGEDPWQTMPNVPPAQPPSFPSSSPPPLPAASAWDAPGTSSSWETPAAAGGGSSWDSAPAPAAEEGGDPWARYQDGPDANGKGEAKKAAGKSKLPLILGLLAVLLLLAAGGWWWMDASKVPVVEISESSIEVQEGKEPRAVEISVQHGMIDVEAVQLPDGLYLVEEPPLEEDENRRIYSLLGSPKQGAESMEVSLVAAREPGSDRRSEPVQLSIEIKPKPMEWTFTPPKLQVGTAIDAASYTKIVTGARQVGYADPAAAPDGLVIQPMPGTQDGWMLAGTPRTAGTVKLDFKATPARGEPEVRSYTLNIEAAPPPPEPVAPPPAASEAGTVAMTPPADGSAPNALAAAGQAPGAQVPPAPTTPSAEEVAEKARLDGAMRTFLLERIEKANDHFTELEKNQLRAMVGMLQEAKMIARVTFPTGKTSLIEREKRILKEALSDADNLKLLEDADCEILVVGYASPSGSPAMNIRLSRQRASTVNDFLRSSLGRDADLCGDYGPTDIVSTEQLGNQAVEIFAGKIALPEELESSAKKFKDDFNRRHGAR